MNDPVYEYAVMNGLGRFLCRAESLDDARAAVASDQSGPGLIPKRSIFRRVRAGAWEVVS